MLVAHYVCRSFGRRSLGDSLSRSHLLPLIAAALLIAAVSIPPSANAGWQKLTNPSGRVVNCAFFFSEQIGWIGTDDAGSILYTTDGGQKWTKGLIVNLPVLTPPSAGGFSFTSIFMTDPLKGWATAAGPATNNPMLFRTLDGGRSWLALNYSGAGSCVYETSKAVTASSTYLRGNGLSSLDGGATFTSNNIQQTNGIDFVDDLNGVMSCIDYEAPTLPKTVPPTLNWWYRTTNGGVTWTQLNANRGVEVWSVYAKKGTSTFLAAPEEDQGNSPSPIRNGSPIIESNDFGVTWTRVGTAPIRTTGHLAGMGDILYVQTDKDFIDNKNAKVSGLYRSTDRGRTWVSVGGPSISRDRRFAVTGCKGGIVYAFDDGGDIWKTRDGGDGQLAEPTLEPTITPQPLSLSAAICTSSEEILTFRNDYCLYDSLISIAFDEYQLVDNGAVTITSAPTLPVVYQTSQGGDIKVKWDPSRAALGKDTTVKLHLRIKFYSRALDRIVDGVYEVNATAKAAPPQVQLSQKVIQLDSLYPCLPRDSALTIHSTSCDTVWITSAYATPSSQLQLMDVNGAPLAFPIAVPPDSTHPLKFQASGILAGPLNGQVRMHVVHQGYGIDTSIDIITYVKAATSFSVQDTLKIDTVAICASRDSAVWLRNLGCDSLHIKSISLKSGKEFTLLTTKAFGIESNDSGSIAINYTPSAQGYQGDTLYVTVEQYGLLRTLEIPIRSFGGPDPSLLAFNVGSNFKLDIHDYTTCDPLDSVVLLLANPGCTRISITEISLDTSIPVLAGKISPRIPLALVEGNSIRVTLFIRPWTRGHYYGNLHVKFSFPGLPERDTALPFDFNVGHGARTLDLATQDHDLGEIRFCATQDDEVMIQNLGCDTIYITDRTLLGAGFVLLTNTPLPIKLDPKQSITEKLRYVPVQSGPAQAVYSIQTDADDVPDRQIRIYGLATPTDSISIKGELRSRTVVAGDSVYIDILSDRSVKSKGLNGVRFKLSYNGDVLTYREGSSMISNATFKTDPLIPTGGKTVYLPVVITGTDIAIDSTKPIARLTFSSAISDSSYSRMNIEDLVLNNGDFNFGKCVLGATSISGTVDLSFLCGDSTIKDFLRHKKNWVLQAQPVWPNPSRVGAGSKLTIPFATLDPGAAKVSVFNEHGDQVATSEQTIPSAGAFEFTYAPQRLTSGPYWYELSLQTTDGKLHRQFGSFVITK